MSVPHPKGPRAFRNFCETAPKTERKARPAAALVSSVDTTWLRTSDALAPSQGIDLTSFASRVEMPAGAAFDLPPGFFSRLNALKVATTTPGHPLDLSSYSLSAMSEKA